MSVMRTTQRKGDVAVSQAIARFTKMGYDVALPLTESAAYDLIIDTADGLKRIQVRYSGAREVALRRIHSNSKGYVVKKTKADAYDWLYIFKNTGEEYLIKKCLANRNSVTPTAEYRLN
jgi:dsDNA-binding SOS-regulon protein